MCFATKQELVSMKEKYSGLAFHTSYFNLTPVKSKCINLTCLSVLFFLYYVFSLELLTIV